MRSRNARHEGATFDTDSGSGEDVCRAANVANTLVRGLFVAGDETGPRVRHCQTSNITCKLHVKGAWLTILTLPILHQTIQPIRVDVGFRVVYHYQSLSPPLYTAFERS